MRVLITGGAGFIGSHLVGSFAARGEQVAIIDDLSTGRLAAVPPGADLVVTDIAEPSVVGVIADLRPGLVIHAAAQASVTASIADPERDRAVNLEGTRHVIAAARQASEPPRLVFLSSGGAIYGETTGADEDAPARPDSPYAAHKLAAEQAVAESGLPHAIARIANVYGPRQRGDLEGGVVAIFADRLGSGEQVTIFGDGEQTRDFVHVDDVVKAIGAMADAAVSGTWNVGTGRATSVNQLLALLEVGLGPAVEARHEPERPGDVRHSRLVIGRAATQLGWQARISLEEGIARLTA